MKEKISMKLILHSGLKAKTKENHQHAPYARELSLTHFLTHKALSHTNQAKEAFPLRF